MSMGSGDQSVDQGDEGEITPIPPGTFGFGHAHGFSRRSLLAGGALALSAIAAACSSDAKTTTTTAAPTTAGATATTTGSTAATGAPTTTAAGSTVTTAGGATTTGAGTAGATTVAGSVAPEAQTETLTLGVQSLQEQYVDPHFAVGGLIFPLTWAISEGLYRQDQNAQYLPALATSYTLSDDKLTWTFTLRTGVKMHDGSAFTANDVKTAVDRIIQGADFTHLATFKSYVTAANVIDDTHVAIVTNKPYATLVSDMPPPIPTGYYNQVGDAAFRKAPMAAGAWKFASQSLNADVRYDRFDDYWDPTRKPNFRKLVFLIVPDESSRVAGIQTGSLDIAFGLSAAAAKQFDGDSKNKVNETKDTALAYVFAIDNNFPDQPSPLLDVNVRKALLMAIDRDGIAKSLYGGFARTAQSPIPPVMMGFDPSVKALPYDPEGAKKMLAAAGAAGMSLTLNSYNATPSIPDVAKLAETIASLWNAIGIKTTLNVADSGTILPAWRSKQLKGAGLLAGPVYFYVEPSRLTSSFFSSKAAYSTVSNAELDALVDQINQETDKAKRTALGKQLSDLLSAQLWGLPIITVSSLAVTGPNVASYTTMAGCPYAGPLYWLSAK
ncbi:MAG: extracellular solute-binding protein family 5 [Ilumatobacteraceae bacterium]|nr:extracellular solute-binding protein family 5 [Ilumatobacteraceae bacterium]